MWKGLVSGFEGQINELEMSFNQNKTFQEIEIIIKETYKRSRPNFI